MPALRDAAVILAFAVLAALMVVGELRKQQVTAELSREVRAFMATGKRFPLRYGLGICERVRKLEKKADVRNPIDCDAIRHVVE